MKTIHKYRLPHTGINYVSMPSSAQVLHVAEQDNELTMWAMVDANMTYADGVEIHVYGTGSYSISEGVNHLNHVGTVIMTEGPVWHVFRKF